MYISYEVSIHGLGCPIIRQGPMEGCHDFPQHKWVQVNRRPLGLARARTLADAQPCHAVVNVWMSAEKVYDNGRPPSVLEGTRDQFQEQLRSTACIPGDGPSALPKAETAPGVGRRRLRSTGEGPEPVQTGGSHA